MRRWNRKKDYVTGFVSQFYDIDVVFFLERFKEKEDPLRLRLLWYIEYGNMEGFSI